MNKTYRSVWNETTGTWVAVQENASARSKSGGGKASRKFLPANAVMVAAGIGSFAFAQHAMAGSIENCGNGQSSYASFTNWTGTWGTVATTGLLPQDCTYMPSGAAMPGSGVIISEDPNYFNPSSKYATILIGQTGSNGAAAGVVSIYGPSGINLMNQTSLNNNKIVSLASGTVSNASLDAVNGSQLYGVASSVAADLGGGSKVASDGSVKVPSYVLSGKTYNDVGSALAAVSSSSSSTDPLAVHYDKAAMTKVTLGGSSTAPAVTLTNVANGTLSASSSDAVSV